MNEHQEVQPSPLGEEVGEYRWRADAECFVRRNANGTDTAWPTLLDVAKQVQVMISSATEHHDGEAVTGYTVKTGALHRLLGMLSAAGHPVTIPLGLSAAPPLPAADAVERVKAAVLATRIEGGLWYSGANGSRLDEQGAEAVARAALSAMQPQLPAVWREALEIIAGRRQCLDNLLSNAAVAAAALDAAPSAQLRADFRERAMEAVRQEQRNAPMDIRGGGAEAAAIVLDLLDAETRASGEQEGRE